MSECLSDLFLWINVIVVVYIIRKEVSKIISADSTELAEEYTHLQGISLSL